MRPLSQVLDLRTPSPASRAPTEAIYPKAVSITIIKQKPMHSPRLASFS